MSFKILGSEAAANTTPSQFANTKSVRLVSTAAAARTVTVYDDARRIQLSINASANDISLLTLANGSTTGIVAGQRILGSSNLAVVNTAVPSQVASVLNSTAFIANVDVIIANGICQVYTTGTKTFTILPNTEIVVVKGTNDFLQSNNDTEILAVPVNERG